MCRDARSAHGGHSPLGPTGLWLRRATHKLTSWGNVKIEEREIERASEHTPTEVALLPLALMVSLSNPAARRASIAITLLPGADSRRLTAFTRLTRHAATRRTTLPSPKGPRRGRGGVNGVSSHAWRAVATGACEIDRHLHAPARGHLTVTRWPFVPRCVGSIGFYAAQTTCCRTEGQPDRREA